MQQTARADRVPAAKPAGPMQGCIPLAQIRESRVRDDRTIDFRVGSQWYRNTLPYQCSSLGFERAFSYETSLSQLCSTDIIHVLQHFGDTLEPATACGLGQFQPIELEKQPKM
ncbi:MAG: hypothetical protein KGL48_06750 [Sphingomonadales bacterium]|nr:hypothetical protein [Sphingomonadales bacterium]MDE2570440.1 hypothetical protein [Sphingomonadales bacterium]